ncbi:hypothetical protein M8494_15660 [Serratia ureilytica]
MTASRTEAALLALARSRSSPARTRASVSRNRAPGSPHKVDARACRRALPYVALDWLLTGRTGAREALSRRHFPYREGRPGEEALRIAEQIAAKDLAASQTVKAIVRQGWHGKKPPHLAFQQGPVERPRRAAARR